MKKVNALLVLFISSLAITGISYIDGKIWDLVFIATGIIAYAIVGLLFSIGVLHGKRAGKDAYAFVFFLLILGGYAIYKALLKLKMWLVGLPLFVKILIPSVISIVIVLIIIFAIIKKKRSKVSDPKGF